MYSDDQIFIWDVDRIREILNNPTPSNLVQSSVFLRRLLIDTSSPLIHRVSRGRDFKVRFHLVDNPKESEENEELIRKGALRTWHNPDPLDSPYRTKVAFLDEFLKEELLLSGEGRVTVKDIITYVANVAGGVHKGSPSEKNNAAFIDRSSNTLQLAGIPYPLFCIQAICSIVNVAVTPLYLRMRA